MHYTMNPQNISITSFSVKPVGLLNAKLHQQKIHLIYKT